MAVGHLLVLAFVGERIRTSSAIIGGIGFGTFIDELGKFITADNDYFYEPTIALIYVIFILMFLLVKQSMRLQQKTPRQHLLAALEHLQDYIITGASRSEREKILSYLSIWQPTHPFHFSKKTSSSKLKNITSKVSSVGKRVSRNSWIHNIVLTYLFLQVIGTVALISLVIFFVETMTPYFYAYIFTAIITSLMYVHAYVLLFRKKTQQAYRLLIQALLISLFIEQILLFLNNQLASLSTLVVRLGMYLLIKSKLKD